MQRSIFDFVMVGVYILLVLTFGTTAIMFVRESARVKPIDRRVARVAQVLCLVSTAAAFDSLYWAFAQSGRIGFLPHLLGQTLYKSTFIFVPKSGLLLSVFILWYLLRKREIPELGKESEEARKIRILHQITSSTTQTLDLPKMLTASVPRMLELTGMHCASVYLRNSITGALDLAAAFGETVGPQAPVHLEVGSDPIADAAESDRPVLLNSQRTGHGKDRSGSTVYVPLVSKEHSIGVLVLDSAEPRIFTSKDIDLLIAIGSQLAVGIENAVLFRENQSLLIEATKSATGLAQTVEERTQLLHEAQEKLGIAETHKRQFYKDTVLAVTAGKLVIVEPEELPEIGMQPTEICILAHREDIGHVRKVIKLVATELGMPKTRVDNLALACGEAMTNALKHGGEGTVRIYSQQGVLHIAIEDCGPGIDALTLPKATLLKGYSTKPSLGMGYALILELSDKVYLCTGPTGTIVILEMLLKEPGNELTIDIVPDTWGQV